MDMLNIVAPALIIIGALLTASNLGNRITGFGFIAFTAGSIGWLGVGLLVGPSSLLWQNIVLTVLNGFGVWRWLGRERQIEKGAECAAEISREAKRADTLFPGSSFSGGTVSARGGEAVAKSVEAMIDCRTGEPHYLVISIGGVAGAGETLRRVPWDRVIVVDNGFMVDTDRRGLPQFDEVERDSWPAR
ncbi:MAG: PRC-barrel domain-containing protein [Sphingomicrobium sp.]